MMMPRPKDAIEIFQVDAFTTQAFCGNPAGVVPDASGLSESQMQLVAREMNLSETAFVTPGGAPGRFRVRFFTPRCEVDLCGHATIATFHLLCELGRIPLAGGPAGGRALVEQVTNAGLLPVEVRARRDASSAPGAGVGSADGGPGAVDVMMTQARPSRRGPLAAADEDELARLLGAGPGGLGIAGATPGGGALRPEVVNTGLPDLLVPVADPAALSRLSPHLEALAAFCRAREIISVHAFSALEAAPGSGRVTCRVTCRDFSPAVGVPEEAATGTASGALGAYLAFNRALGAAAGGVFHLTCEQGANLGRPSLISVEVSGPAGAPEVVRVGGCAVTVLRGTMTLPPA
jgi:trans-2,3-dihydro-3-hydroxyanthranilate isomerase